MQVRVLSWNIFHGRDAPPDPRLFSWRSRICRRSERNETHVQVNRPLLPEFTTVLSALPWEVALLQEAPPRWLRPLCAGLRAHGASALTSRNFGAALRGWAAELNPDLIASGEGGSNQLLARPPWEIAAVRRLTIARRPERRRMLWCLLRHPGGEALCVAGLHATAGHEPAAGREVEAAAECAVAWAGERPLVFGGDFNLRPRSAGEVFERLERRFSLAPPTAAGAIDHLLARGLAVVEAPCALPARARELPAENGLALCLSDHAPVVARFDAAARQGGPSPRSGGMR